MNPTQTSELSTTEKSAQDKLAELCNEAISLLTEASMSIRPSKAREDGHDYAFRMGVLSAEAWHRADDLRNKLQSILDTAKQ